MNGFFMLIYIGFWWSVWGIYIWFYFGFGYIFMNYVVDCLFLIIFFFSDYGVFIRFFILYCLYFVLYNSFCNF